jgi:hypothetical protein
MKRGEKGAQKPYHIDNQQKLTAYKQHINDNDTTHSTASIQQLK